MTAAAIYCRISSDLTGLRAGVERQETECRELVERHGWDLDRVFVDNDISAYSGKARPQYLAMLEAMKAGELDVIVAWHPDRLHRAPVELEAFITAVEAADVEVATVTAGILDLATASGRMNARIVGAVARGESEHKSERIRSQRVQAADAGRFFGGRVPFGYRLEDGRLEVVEVEAAAIRDAYEFLLAGGRLTRVVEDWAARGLGGRKWTLARAREALTRPRLAGQVVHRGQIMRDVPGDWEAIVTVDELAMLGALFDGRRTGARKARVPTLLGAGIARCATCDRNLIVHRGEKYRCNGCSLTVNRNLLDGYVADQFRTYLAQFTNLYLIEPVEHDNQGAALEAVHAAERRLDEIATMFGTGELDVNAYKAARAAVTVRLEAARAELGETVAAGLAPGEYVDEHGDHWIDPTAVVELAEQFDGLELDEQRRVLTESLVKLEIKPARSTRFDPGRVTLEWRQPLIVDDGDGNWHSEGWMA